MTGMVGLPVLVQGGSEGAPVFVPPMRGAPATQVGGGTRGQAGRAQIQLLAPRQVAYASTPQPNLYWYLDGSLSYRAEISVLDDQSAEPLLETTLAASKPGMQHLSLAKQGVKLLADRDYEWSIILIQDEKQRSNDVVATGPIRYVPLSADLQKAITAASEEEKAHRYAEAGYWYDAMDHLARLLTKHPNQDRYRHWRNQLLEQVGLPPLN
ncbi:MAG: DUF928 domain-containing protein [Magnetococcales bacterium]|nr:DUF928 domain-containing protein [Magnetococcales bacterium]